MILMLSPPTSFRLSTIERVRAELQAPESVTDAELGLLLDRASVAIANHCGRMFGEHRLQEEFPAKRRTRHWILTSIPVLAVERVMEGARTLDPSEYRVDSETGILRRTDGSSWAGVLVTYRAGYVLPGADAPTLPADIEDACLLEVAARYHARGRDPLLRSRTVEGVGSSSYTTPLANGAGGLLSLAMLAPHRRSVGLM